MTAEQRRQIISQMNGRTQLQAFEAAKTIWNDPDQQFTSPLTTILRRGRRPFYRAAAAYAMQVLVNKQSIAALERALANRSEHPRVRGEAAEALAHGHRSKSHELLLRGLDDRSKDVRFWCAFALGEMAELRAIKTLQHIAETDKRIVKGFHSVAKEAIDAIRNIQKEKPFHRRKNGCVFCIDRRK
jgi:HEAT repeat protein